MSIKNKNFLSGNGNGNSSQEKQDAKDRFRKATAISARSESILFLWNHCRNLPEHKYERGKGISTVVKDFDKSIKILDTADIVESIINYDRALESKKSKLSVGEGRLFKFNINSFFKFTNFDIKAIKENSRKLEIIDYNNSLYRCFWENPNYFDYDKKDTIVTENLMNYYKNFHKKAKNIINRELEFDKTIIPLSIEKVNKFLKNDKGLLFLNQGETYELSGTISESMTIENCLYWLCEFIADDLYVRKIFKFYHLKVDFFYERFREYLYQHDRIKTIYETDVYETDLKSDSMGDLIYYGNIDKNGAWGE